MSSSEHQTKVKGLAYIEKQSCVAVLMQNDTVQLIPVTNVMRMVSPDLSADIGPEIRAMFSPPVAKK